MKTEAGKRIVGALLLSLLVSCGGGGGGGTGSAGVVIGTAAEYWAADAAALWLFEGRDNAQGRGYRDRVTMGGALAIGGRTLERFEYSRPFNDPSFAGPQYRSLDADGIHAYLDVAPTSLASAYLELPAQIRQETYRAFEQTYPIAGGTETDSIDVTVAGFENLALPGGTFDKTLKVTQRYTITLTINGQTVGASSNLSIWYAKGIGIVRQVLDDPSTFPATTTYVEELAGVSLPAVRGGVIGELTLLDGLAPGVSSLTTGRPGAASDGTGFVVAARRMDVFSFATQLVATYLDGAGRILWSQVVIDDLGLASPGSDYSDPVAVAFDGTAFWIVARTSTLNSTTLVRQRVTPAGLLLDPSGGVAIADGVWPSLAANGSSVLLVLARNLGGPNFDWAMFATLYAADGSVLHAEQQIALPGNGNSGFASVTANAGQYLVSYEVGDPRDVYALRIDGTGAALDPSSFVVSAAAQTQGDSAVAAWGASDFAAVWIDARNYAGGLGQFDVFGSRISEAGAVLDGPPATGGVALNLRASERFGTAGAGGAAGTLLAWTGGSFVNLTTDPVGIFGRRFAPGAPLAVAAPADDGLVLGLLHIEDFGVRVMAPVAAASTAGHFVAWVHNTELSGAMKSVRGVLVYPPVIWP
jgi:hypothetical protein